MLVIPKEHHRNGGALAAADPGCSARWSSGAHAVAQQEGLVTDGGIEPGYRVVTNTGPQAGQSVDHVHLHVLGGRAAGLAARLTPYRRMRGVTGGHDRHRTRPSGSSGTATSPSSSSTTRR